MRFQNYLNEARSYSKSGKWERRQISKGNAHWVYDKYEIKKQPDGTFNVTDITKEKIVQGRVIFKVVGNYDSLKKAQDSV